MDTKSPQPCLQCFMCRSVVLSQVPILQAMNALYSSLAMQDLYDVLQKLLGDFHFAKGLNCISVDVTCRTPNAIAICTVW